MQKITVLCVGKLKEKFYQEAAAEYAKRLGRHCKLEIVELPESRLPEDPSAAEIQRALAAEAAANAVIWADRPVEITYPDPDTLAHLATAAKRS